MRDGGARERAVRGAEGGDDESEDEDDDVGAEALDDGAGDEERRRGAREEEVLAKDSEAEPPATAYGCGELCGEMGQGAEDEDGEDTEGREEDGGLAEGPAVVLGDVLDERGGVGGHAGVLEERGDEDDGHVAVA